MKELKQIIGLILIFIIWCFPIIISFITWDFWYIMLYVVWWIPSMLISGLIIVIVEN
jgi:hypothetical protein